MQTVAPSDSKGSCKRTQHSQKCWMLHAAFVCTTHRMLLHVFCVLLLSCCAKFETGQTFKKATPNIVLLSPKRSAIVLVLTLLGVVASVCTIPHANTDATIPNIFARSLTLRSVKRSYCSQANVFVELNICLSILIKRLRWQRLRWQIFTPSTYAENGKDRKCDKEESKTHGNREVERVGAGSDIEQPLSDD